MNVEVKQLGGLSVELFFYDVITKHRIISVLRRVSGCVRRMAEDILPNWLKKRADITPERPAIEFEGITYSFSELDQMVEHMAGKLAAKGVQAGDTGAILLRNHIDSVVIIHALFYLGVRIVMLITS